MDKNIIYDMFMNQFNDNPRPYTEADFSPAMIQQLRQNVFNQEHDLKERVQELLNTADYRHTMGDKDYDPILRREFSYRNYGSGNYKDPFEMGNKELAQKFFSNNDPRFQVQTTIGSGRYSIDPKGNVIVTDEYDFSKRKYMQNLAQILHLYGALKGKPYPITINLGNINDWGLKYTGNRELDAYYNRNKRFQSNRI